jgi:hypothetical protein
MPADDAALHDLIAAFRANPIATAKHLMLHQDFVEHRVVDALLDENKPEDIKTLLTCLEQRLMVTPIIMGFASHAVPQAIPYLHQKLWTLFPKEASLLYGAYDAHKTGVGERYVYSLWHDWLTQGLAKAGWQPTDLNPPGMAYWLIVDEDRLLLDYGLKAINWLIWIATGQHPSLVGQSHFGQPRFNETRRGQAARTLGRWLASGTLPHILRDHLNDHAEIIIYNETTDYYGDGEVITYRLKDFWHR